MAKDGISIHFRGGAKLDAALVRISNVKQSKASAIVYSSLTQAANAAKKSIKSATPVGDKDFSGRDGSRGAKSKVHGHTKGTLRRSLTIRLQRTSILSKNPNVFAASVFIADGHGRNKEKDPNKDGWYAHFVTMGTPNHIPNDFMAKGLKAAENAIKKKLGSSIAKKIALFGQIEINKLG